ncbi:hypothetical protein SRB5_70910 [Streptomyces sp. RB5]|uniref:Putative restriction endonuclease domain-containing protein n=1 Tax=Streptomyces smaragdinus TaxID=2585196 RepID=A0A7K0CTX9_9ACTN|nr:Uma2 family endonuclease [Streptomyces smaragdinus]MQY16888.1 hypothetical protein [Streptomyces smaragdinus]
MTPSTTDRPEMSTDEFEEIALRAPETVWLEFLRGKLKVKPARDGNGCETVAWLNRYFLERLPELRLYQMRGLRVGSRGADRIRPDGVLAPYRHYIGTGEWAEPDGVLMIVEVISRDVDQRTRVEKSQGYAAAGIPVFLLVDRDAHSVTVHSDPEDGVYRSLTTRPYGTEVELPDPVGITLPTEQLKAYAD